MENLALTAVNKKENTTAGVILPSYINFFFSICFWPLETTHAQCLAHPKQQAWHFVLNTQKSRHTTISKWRKHEDTYGEQSHCWFQKFLSVKYENENLGIRNLSHDFLILQIHWLKSFFFTLSFQPRMYVSFCLPGWLLDSLSLQPIPETVGRVSRDHHLFWCG